MGVLLLTLRILTPYWGSCPQTGGPSPIQGHSEGSLPPYQGSCPQIGVFLFLCVHTGILWGSLAPYQGSLCPSKGALAPYWGLPAPI